MYQHKNVTVDEKMSSLMRKCHHLQANMSLFTSNVWHVPVPFHCSEMQLLDEILKEMASNTFSDEEQAEFWDDFDNLQKAKIVR